MAALREITRLIRSKNAGPFELTFDLIFASPAIYQQVKESGTINSQLFSQLYGIPEELVRVFAYDPAFAYKITIPRSHISGAVGDNDVYGAQQFGPLVDLDIPLRQ